MTGQNHRRKLIVLCYRIFRVNYLYPFFREILYYFIIQNHHKNQSNGCHFLLFMINYHILGFTRTVQKKTNSKFFYIKYLLWALLLNFDLESVSAHCRSLYEMIVQDLFIFLHRFIFSVRMFHVTPSQFPEKIITG